MTHAITADMLCFDFSLCFEIKLATWTLTMATRISGPTLLFLEKAKPYRGSALTRYLWNIIGIANREHTIRFGFLVKLKFRKLKVFPVTYQMIQEHFQFFSPLGAHTQRIWMHCAQIMSYTGCFRTDGTGCFVNFSPCIPVAPSVLKLQYF